MSMIAADVQAAGSLDSAGPVTVWVVVLGFVFLECAFVIGLFLPGDSLLFAAGVVLAQHSGPANAVALGVVATVVAVLGNQVGYLVGRHTGTRILARRGGRVLNQSNLTRATEFVERWGFWSVVFARWIPWVRTLAPMIAGAARMDNRRFLMANTIGALCWVPALIMLGYSGASLLDRLPWLQTAATVLAVGFLVIGTGYGVLRYRREWDRPVEDECGQAAAAGSDLP